MAEPRPSLSGLSTHPTCSMDQCRLSPVRFPSSGPLSLSDPLLCSAAPLTGSTPARFSWPGNSWLAIASSWGPITGLDSSSAITCPNDSATCSGLQLGSSSRAPHVPGSGGLMYGVWEGRYRKPFPDGELNESSFSCPSFLPNSSAGAGAYAFACLGRVTWRCHVSSVAGNVGDLRCQTIPIGLWP